MLNLLIIPFLIILFILILGFGLLKGIFRFFFGTPTASKDPNQTRRNARSSTWRETSAQKKEKVFNAEDGEYIDFEEIKEEK